MNARQILGAKKHRMVVTIDPDRSTYEALQLMAEHNIGCVAVMEDGALIGLLTERDYARRIVLEGKKSRHTPVRETMQETLLTIPPDRTIEECMELMTEKRVRYLPVLEGEVLRGIVSIGDVVKSVIAEQEQNIQHLERFVQGAEYGGS